MHPLNPSIGPERPDLARIGPIDDVEALAAELAAELGEGWTLEVVPNPYHPNVRTLVLAHADGRRRITVAGDRQLSPKRIRMNGQLPQTDYQLGKGEEVKATAAIERGAKVIAAHLASDRFMGLYQRMIAKIDDFNRDKAYEQQEIDLACRQLISVLAHGAKFEVSPFSGKIDIWSEGRKIEATLYAGDWRMKLGYMPLPVAVQVATAYDQAMAVQLGENPDQPAPVDELSNTPAATAPPANPGPEPVYDAPLGPVDQLAAELADELGEGWSLLTETSAYSRDQYLVHTDGRKLHITGEHPGWGPGSTTLPTSRVRISGVFPRCKVGNYDDEYRFKNSEHPDTTAAITRGAKAIARQILSQKFMPHYEAVLAKVVAHNEKQRAAKAAMQTAGDALAAAFRHGATVTSQPYEGSVSSSRAGRRFTAKLYQATEAEIELSDLTQTAAIAVITAYERAVGEHRGEQPTQTQPGSAGPAEQVPATAAVPKVPASAAKLMTLARSHFWDVEEEWGDDGEFVVTIEANYYEDGGPRETCASWRLVWRDGKYRPDESPGGPSLKDIAADIPRHTVIVEPCACRDDEDEGDDMWPVSTPINRVCLDHATTVDAFDPRFGWRRRNGDNTWSVTTRLYELASWQDGVAEAFHEQPEYRDAGSNMAGWSGGRYDLTGQLSLEQTIPETVRTAYGTVTDPVHPDQPLTPAPCKARERLMLLTCGGHRADTDQPVPVGEMSVGSYHRAARCAADAWVRDGKADRIHQIHVFEADGNGGPARARRSVVVELWTFAPRRTPCSPRRCRTREVSRSTPGAGPAAHRSAVGATALGAGSAGTAAVECSAECQSSQGVDSSSAVGKECGTCGDTTCTAPDSPAHLYCQLCKWPHGEHRFVECDAFTPEATAQSSPLT
ncbi:hypothetical protein ACH41H_24140 [Streptomyces sp. NPDC020800]|uniref:hypothetical protein n=1 Tax=Streptomyces sp. NPDC020800 TaxID=3365092 RepID=UPI0037AF9A6F